MCSSFQLLRVESRDFSHAEKERTVCKAEQILKLTTIFTQNVPTYVVILSENHCHFANFFSFTSSFFFSQLKKNYEIQCRTTPQTLLISEANKIVSKLTGDEQFFQQAVDVFVNIRQWIYCMWFARISKTSME